METLIVEATRVPKVHLDALWRHLVSARWRSWLGYGATFLCLFAFYGFLAQFNPNNADDASVILEGQAMLHGNLFMHGWFLPPDSFITTEIPLYALGSLALPSRLLLKFIPALLYAATIFTALLMARRRVQATPDRWLATCACLALIAFPTGLLFTIALQSPMHFGTLFLSLLAFIAYDRFVHHERPYSSLAFFMFFTAISIAGDPMAEILIPVPVGLACASVLWRTRGRDRQAQILVAAAGFGALAGNAIIKLLVATGTHIMVDADKLQLVGLEKIWRNVKYALLGICLLFHIDPTAPIRFSPQLLSLVLNAGLLLLGLVALVRFYWGTLFPAELSHSLAGVMAWASVGLFGVFLVADFAQEPLAVRYLFPAFVYAAICLYPALAKMIPSRYHIASVASFLALSLASFGTMLWSAPPAPVPEQPLITFLLNHHLTQGIGTYWSANIVTLQSGSQVTIRAVAIYDVTTTDPQIAATIPPDPIQPIRWHANEEWFRSGAARQAQFVVLNRQYDDIVLLRTVTRTLGQPDHLYTVGQYTILAWDHPFDYGEPSVP